MAGHRAIDTEHLLLGLLGVVDGVAAQVLNANSITTEHVRDQLVAGETTPGHEPSHMPFTPASREVLESSVREALQLGHEVITERHILLALARHGQGKAAEILHAGGLGVAELQTELAAVEVTADERQGGEWVEPGQRATRPEDDDAELVVARTRLSTESRAVLRRALAESITAGADKITPRHLLLALLGGAEGESMNAMVDAIDGDVIDLDALRKALRDHVDG